MVSPGSNLGKRNRSEITDTSGTDLTPDFSDAFEYVLLLKEKLDADKYQNLLNILDNFKNKSICPVESVNMVKDLLEGHPDLLSGFMHFVPNWCLGEINHFPYENKPNYEDTSAFLSKVKGHFSDNDEKYRSLLSILNMYLINQKSVDQVHEEVTRLFQGHPDLIQEFSNLIPKA